MGYLISIIVFQTIFTLTLLFFSPSKKVFDKFLTLLLILMSLHFSVKLLFLLNFKSNLNYYTLPTSFGFVYGPSLYFLTLSTFKTFNFKKMVAHFIPFVLMSILYVIILVHLNSSMIENILIYPYYTKIIFLELIWSVIYPIINFKILKKNKQKINISKFNLLKVLNVLVLGLPVLLTIFLILEPFGITLNIRLVYIFMLLMVISIAVYKFNVKVEAVAVKKLPVDSEKKYTSSNLSTEDIDAYQTKLEKYVTEKKPYLQPDLTLQILSDKCNIPKHHLTQVLNTRFNKNFYQYINEYRVKEVIKKIPKKKKESLVDIAYQCGFNSKSTFNNYFKKITGLTPSQFKKQSDLLA